MDSVLELLKNDSVLALIGALFGGGGLEVIRRVFDRKQRKSDEAAKMRAELKTDIESLRKQLSDSEADERRLEAELERWKGLYYEQREEMLRQIADLQVLKARLEALEVPPTVTLERQSPK